MGLLKRAAVLGRLQAVRALLGCSFSSNFVFHVLSVAVFAHIRANSRLSILVSGPVHFGQVPEEHWYQPSWINETRATEERNKMEEEGVIYGGSLSCGSLFSCPISMMTSVAYRYRNMCRFNSGVRFRSPLICW
jgi:hypothetical protein